MSAQVVELLMSKPPCIRRQEGTRMKVTIIEGSPEELADFEARTGMIGRAEAGTNALDHAGEPLAAGDAEAISGGELVGTFRSFISGRAREPEISANVE